MFDVSLSRHLLARVHIIFQSLMAVLKVNRLLIKHILTWRLVHHVPLILMAAAISIFDVRAQAVALYTHVYEVGAIVSFAGPPFIKYLLSIYRDNLLPEIVIM